MNPATAPFVVEIVSIVSLGVFFPAVVIGGILASRMIRLKDRALAVREKELELEREKLSFATVREGREAIERAGELGGAGQIAARTQSAPARG